jgi:energy-coupling factor transport system substrate-specific component
MQKKKKSLKKTNKNEKLKVTPKYHFTVRDLVIIAVLCSLGGVMSTYVKYIANLINIAFGVPFGAAQMVAGLHVFWLVLCFGLIRKIGTGTTAGFLKGVIELFSGNPHGITVVLISGIEGIFIDLGMTAFRKKHAIYSYGISAGFAAASEVWVFYPLFLPSMPIWFIFATSALAFSSGVVFGGFFGTGTLELLHLGRVARIPNWQPTRTQESNLDDLSKKKSPKSFLSKVKSKPFYVASIVFILFFSIGGVAYYLTVPNLFGKGNTCKIEGNVENPYTYDPNDFKEYKVTIKTELAGAVTVEGEKEYSGVPLYVIINHSNPKNDVSQIRVIGSDGYERSFDWDDVKNDDRMILIEENDTLRLITGDYTLTDCVRMVDRIVVE